MYLALRLARRGEGFTSPNPMVGAVLARKDTVVGSGYHHVFGGPHAEIEALQRAGRKARNADLYVTMEPCCFCGKTGACTDALKAAGFALAVGSSGPIENVESALRGLGRAHLFDAIVSSTEVVRGKPEPEVFLKAAAKLAINPPQCAVLEDSLAGLEAARRAGMVAIGLTGTFDRAPLAAKADLVVESLRELSPETLAALIDARSGRRECRRATTARGKP